MRIRIQLLLFNANADPAYSKKLCKKLPYEEFAVVEKKIAQKGKTMELVQIFVKNLNKIQLKPIFLNLDFFQLVVHFQNECGSMRIRITQPCSLPDLLISLIILQVDCHMYLSYSDGEEELVEILSTPVPGLDIRWVASTVAGKIMFLSRVVDPDPSWIRIHYSGTLWIRIPNTVVRIHTGENRINKRQKCKVEDPAD